jgi:excinuclease UvrABC nuclease subunit
LQDVLQPPDLSKFRPIEARPGVYLLFNEGGEIVYVGQSCNCARRIQEHAKTPKVFSNAQFYHLPSENARLILEGILILYFRPVYNRGINLGLSCGRVWEIKWPSARRRQPVSAT